jgi:antitoxin ParD1/3/4
MATMNVSLPDQMKSWVEKQAETGRYSNSSDYVRDLIRREQDRASAREWFEAEIEKGYASGFIETTTEELFDELAAEIEATVPAHKSA